MQYLSDLELRHSRAPAARRSAILGKIPGPSLGTLSRLPAVEQVSNW